MPVRNQHPAQLTQLHMDPAGASPLSAGDLRVRVDGAYSSLFLGGANGNDRFLMDGEILRTGLKARVGLGGGFELSSELAFASTTGGFLDAFLIDFHDFVGSSDQGRSEAPRNHFDVHADNDNTTVFAVEEDDFALLDTPLQLSWSPLPVTEGRPFGFALRAATEIPTGDDERGYGSGQIDWAVGVTGEARAGSVAFTGHVQHTFAGSPGPARRANFEFADVTSLGVGAEIALSDSIALLVQTEWESSTLRGLDLDRADDPQWLLWTGVRAAITRTISCEFALGEDLSPYIAPDFTAWVAFVFDIGSSQP
jgi:hypothetical protein